MYSALKKINELLDKRSKFWKSACITSTAGILNLISCKLLIIAVTDGIRRINAKLNKPIIGNTLMIFMLRMDKIVITATHTFTDVKWVTILV